MARAKCPICTQSTSTDDGACEFCGHELEAEIVADAAERASRLAAPARGARPSEVETAPRPPARVDESRMARGGVRDARDVSDASPLRDHELRDAESMGAMSFAIALVSLFLFPIVAPVAHRLGRNSIRLYEKHGVTPHWNASAGYWIGLLMSLLILFGLFTVLALFVFAYSGLR